MMAVVVVAMVVVIVAAVFDGFALALFWPIGFYMYVCMAFLVLVVVVTIMMMTSFCPRPPP